MFCPSPWTDPEEPMPVYMPPSPPATDEDEDLYREPVLDYWYMESPMTESDLPDPYSPPIQPPILARSPDTRPRKPNNSSGERYRSERDRAAAEDRLDISVSETIRNVLAQSQASSPSPRFDQAPTKLRRDLRRPLTPPPPALEGEEDEGPEWNILQDLLLLEAVTKGQQMSYNLLSTNPGHTPNWDFVAQQVNSLCPHSHLTPRQCSLRYQLVVLPREDGRLVTFDPITKKPRKIPITTQEMANVRKGRLKTGQQFEHDGKALIAAMVANRFEALRIASLKKLQPFRPIRPKGVRGGALEPPPKQQMILGRMGVVKYEAALSPAELSDLRDQRARDRILLQQRQADAAQAAQAQQAQAAQAAALDHAQLARYPPTPPPNMPPPAPPAQSSQLPPQQPPPTSSPRPPSRPPSSGPAQPRPSAPPIVRSLPIVSAPAPSTSQPILSSALPPGTRIVTQAPLSLRNTGQAQVRQPSVPSSIRQPRTTPPSTPQPGTQPRSIIPVQGTQAVRVPVQGGGRGQPRGQLVPGGAFLVSAESRGHLVVQSSGVSPRMTVARSQLQAAVKKGGGLPKIATLTQPKIASLTSQPGGQASTSRGPIHLVTAYHGGPGARVPSQHPPQVHMLRNPIQRQGSSGSSEGGIPSINVLMQVPAGRAQRQPIRPQLHPQTDSEPHPDTPPS